MPRVQINVDCQHVSWRGHYAEFTMSVIPRIGETLVFPTATQPGDDTWLAVEDVHFEVLRDFVQIYASIRDIGQVAAADLEEHLQWVSRDLVKAGFTVGWAEHQRRQKTK